MRAVTVILLLISAGFVVLWQLDVIDFQSRGQNRQNRALQELFEAIKINDIAGVQTLLEAETDINIQDEEGLTSLMYAAKHNKDSIILIELIAAGANLNTRDNAGLTALMHAALENRNPEIALALLNAGADPTITDNEGNTVYEHAANNSTLRRSRIYKRLENLVASPFDFRWPSGYTLPVEGATFTSRVAHLPNQPRAYRNGVHQGFDFFNIVVSTTIDYGTPVRAVASGKIAKADHGYLEMSEEEYNALIEDARIRPITPEDTLDRLRGKQVWVEHMGGYTSRYAHLQNIPDSLQIGNVVRPGQIIGYIGNSGTIEAVQNTQDEPHLHFEFWDSEGFLGENLEAEGIYGLVAQVFGKEALPRAYTD